MQNKYLPEQPSKKRAFMLIGAVLFIYLLDNLPIGSIIDIKIYSNYVKPTLWLGLAGLVWIMPRVRLKAPLKLRGNINWWSFNFAMIFIVASIIAGFIDGFGKSPYDHSVIGIIINIFVVGSTLVGREAVRCYTVNSITRDESFLVFMTIALFMTLSSFSIDKFIRLKDIESLVEFAAQFLAPEFLQNLMAAYLTFLGGWIPSTIYIGIIRVFQWFSPILPDLKWITAALVGIMCPAFSLSAMQAMYLKDTRALKSKDKEKEGLPGWIATSLLSIGIIWFTAGVFPIYPSVIATGSMEPKIRPGDMVLIEKITNMEDVNRLEAGDIIQFKREGVLISHRIIEIVEEKKVKNFRTKGDNNSGPDMGMVKPEDLKGKIKYVVPKVGWPTLLIKQKKNVPVEQVE
jgi:signal peptidase